MKSIIRNILTLSILCGAGVAATAAMKQTKDDNTNDAYKKYKEPKDNDRKDDNTNAATKNDIPEFEKYSGHKVGEVEELLNSVTEFGKYSPFSPTGKYFTISRQNFVAIKEKLGVSEIYLRDNYDPFCYCGRDHYDCGDMITFRIRENYCVSNDGFFIIDGKWRYFTVDEVREDYISQAQCKGRAITPDRCCII